MPSVTAPILPGAEPFRHDGGPLGVLVLHGFTGSPQSVRPQAEALAEAGFTVDLPLWPGHGTDGRGHGPDALVRLVRGGRGGLRRAARARARRWPCSGLSMGGTLACWLAEHHPEVRGLCLVNPLRGAAGRQLPRRAAGHARQAARRSPRASARTSPWPARHELAYAGTPIAAVLSPVRGRSTQWSRRGSTTSAARCSCSRAARTTSCRRRRATCSCASVSGPVERVWLEKSYHVATLDHDEAEITRRAVTFVGQVLGPDRRAGEVGARTTA